MVAKEEALSNNKTAIFAVFVTVDITERLTYHRIFYFCGPLALTSILSIGVHPFVTFFLSRSNMAVESLAVLPVVGSLVFIFRSVGLSYHEVNIALMGRERQNFKILKDFALILGLAVTLLIIVMAFTPLSIFYLVPKHSSVVKSWGLMK